MKRVLFIVLAAAMAQGAFAQETQPGKFSHFSIELSTAHPSPMAHTINPENPDAATMYGYYRDKETLGQVNLSLRYNLNRRWDFLLVGTFNPEFYVKMSLPDQDPDTGMWSGEPYRDGVKMKYYDASVMAVARVNYGFFDKCHLYSALGIGVDLGYIVIPASYITPIGIFIGEKHRVYGTAELTYGNAGMGLLAGIGVRL